MLGAYRHSPYSLLACNAQHPLAQDVKVSHSHQMVASQGRCLWLWHASLNKRLKHRVAAVNQLSVSTAGTVAGRHGGGPPPTEVERGGCLAASALDGSCSNVSAVRNMVLQPCFAWLAAGSGCTDASQAVHLKNSQRAEVLLHNSPCYVRLLPPMLHNII